MNPLALISFKVIHSRLKPKKYKFTHNFFWFKLELNSLANSVSRNISINKFGLYSFYDSDHLDLGEPSARANYLKFAKENGLKTEIQSVTLYTQLRFLGYVFNPVSFILLKDTEGKEHAIIEICNTFNELKPYFVSHEHFSQNGFTFKTKKYFYISPFIEHDNEMIFQLKIQEKEIAIVIEDIKQAEKVLQVNFLGNETSFNNKNLLAYTLKSPFVTLQFIFLIHFHALILWLKGIKYFKKNEYTELQRGAYKWKK